MNMKLFHLTFLTCRFSKQSSYVRHSSHSAVSSITNNFDLRVLKYPSPKLRAPNEPVTVFDHNLRALSKKMFELMYDGIGAGLAAPQVGINKNIMVCNVEGDPSARASEIVLVNPRIIEASEDHEIDEEACLSFPDISGPVKRHSRIKVSFIKFLIMVYFCLIITLWHQVIAQDLDGDEFSLQMEGWEARLFQHEYDHLSGILFIDRLDKEHRLLAQPVLDELEREFESLYLMKE